MRDDDTGAPASDEPVKEGSGAAGRRERRTAQLVHQWAALRADRRPAPVQISTGTSNFSRAQVPWGLDLAAAWSWRVLIIGAGVYALALVLAHLAVVTLPLAISLLLAALAGPGVTLLQRVGIPRALAAALVMVFGLTAVVLLLAYVGQQVAAGATDLADSVVAGLGEVKNWLRQGPLNLSQGQLDSWIADTQRAISENSRNGGAVTQATEVGSAVGHFLAGFFIVIFATYFFLADGGRIWAWMVHLAPRAARAHVDGSGRVAWVSLEQFVRATVLVALADAIGVMIVAALLGVPFVLALGVLVFLGAFVPMIGATVAGSVAILVALVDQGPITALLMLGGVVLVQQIEGHVLQPFLMGRFVSVHPLGVIVAIGCGVLVAGIAGALIAVPLVAAGNAVANHLAHEVEPEHYDTPLITDEEVDDVEPDVKQDEPERNTLD